MNYVLKHGDCEITGIDRGDTVAYLGIRFARADRFKKPQLEPLAQKLSALKNGDCCPQERQFFDEGAKRNTFYYDEFRRGLSFTYSEDCLNLNVYAPKTGDKLPVLINIHGGGFVTCSCDERPFDGVNIAKEGVICVCPNYRLNIFGYYADDNICNLALHDILCAIRWVKANIATFGGDPDNITLMGQSAGAISIQSLILLPEVKNTVKRAIMLSGAATSGLFAPKSRALAKRFYKSIDKGIKRRGEGNLNSADYRDVFLAWWRANKRNIVRSLICTMPVFDGETVRKDLYKSAYSDEQMPCIISVTKNDLLKGYLDRCARKWVRNAKGGSRLLYFYRPLPGDKKGAFHSSDLWYIFGLEQHPWRKFDAHDEEIAVELRKRYCAFAKTGNPNVGEYSEWKENDVLTLE